MSSTRPTPDDLAQLDEEYAALLSLLDPTETLRRAVALVPEHVACDKAFAGVLPRVGDPGAGVGPFDDAIGFGTIAGSGDGATGVVTDGPMVIEHLIGTETEMLRHLRIDPGHGLGGKVLDSGKPAWVQDYERAAGITHHYDPFVVGAESIRGLIAAPLYAGDRLHGVLYAAASEALEFGDRAVDHLLQTARRASMALTVAERARHSAELAALEERRRIALDLHDSVGATLFALTASVRSLGDDTSIDTALRDRLGLIEDRAHEASAALRQSVRALSAPPSEVALPVALRADTSAFQERTGVLARAIVMDTCPVVEPSRAATMVQAVREALLNAEKHACARSVVVTLFPTAGGVAVAVSDDGVGPGTALQVCASDDPTSATGGRGGLGLRSSRERLERVGGTMSIAENDDGGTTVRMWVPC